MAKNLSLNDGLITRRTAARRLDVSLRTLDRMVKRGILHPVRQSEKWVRFRVEEIEAYIEQLLEKSAAEMQSV